MRQPDGARQRQHSPRVRRFGPDEWRAYRDLRLRALADAPDAFVTTLAQAQRRSDADWAAQIATASSDFDLPLVAEVRERRAGMAWGTLARSDPGTAHLFQMWVAPESRRLGVGRALLEAVVAWAGGTPARQLELEVTWGDTPARRLYERAGFQAWGEPAPLREGSAVFAQGMRLELEARRAEPT